MKPKFRSNKGMAPKKPKGHPNEGKSKTRMGKGFGGAWYWTNKVTEGGDWIDAAYDALPDWAKEPYGEVPTMDEKIDALSKHYAEVDPSKFVSNAINNQIEDYLYGKAYGRAGRGLNQVAGVNTGGTRALGAPTKNVREDEENPLIPQVEINFADCSINVTW